MIRPVLLTPGALAAFEEARAWLMQCGAGKRGRDRWEALRKAPDTLALNAYRGWEDDEQPGRRQIVVSGYRLLYRIAPDTGDSEAAGVVLILALFVPGQR